MWEVDKLLQVIMDEMEAWEISDTVKINYEASY